MFINYSIINNRNDTIIVKSNSATGFSIPFLDWSIVCSSVRLRCTSLDLHTYLGTLNFILHFKDRRRGWVVCEICGGCGC